MWWTASASPGPRVSAATFVFWPFFALFFASFLEVGLKKVFWFFPFADWSTGAGRGGGADKLPAVAGAPAFRPAGFPLRLTGVQIFSRFSGKTYW